MAISKDLISSPIEAGPSLMDTQKLPAQMMEALDYVSSRLLRKQLHLTLIVVREESTACPLSPSKSPPPPPTPIRAASLSSLSARLRRPESPRSTSSLSSRSTSSLSSHTTVSATSNPSPLSKAKLPPLDTSTPLSTSSPYNISLLHASSLSPKATKHLNTTIAKASKKYALSDSWLTTPTTPTASSPSPFSNQMTNSPCPLSPTVAMENDLIRRSLQQNDLLFSSEGLTLLSLDRVYSFKLALSAYSRTLTSSISQPFSPTSPSPLSPTFTSSSTSDTETSEERQIRQREAKTKAVDELRLLCLSQNNAPISKSYLLRAYDHLPISLSALRAINDAYRAHYHTDGIALPLPPNNHSHNSHIPNVALLRSLSGRERSQSFFAEGRDPIQRLDRGPHYLAPETPGGWEEVTPITRGEWHWLMGDRLPEQKAVETW